MDVSYKVLTLIIVGALCAAMVGLVLLGMRVAARRRAKHGDAKSARLVDTSVFGVLALLVSFLFYGALDRFDQHRKILSDEVGALGTAYHRLDLLPTRTQPALKRLFRAYVDSRIDLYGTDADPTTLGAYRSTALRERIWLQAIDACRAPECPTSSATLVFGALNEAFGYPIKQAAMRRTHPPLIVFAMLFGVALLCAYLAGLDNAGFRLRSKFMVIVYPLTLSMVTWVILDLEYPRLGVTRLSNFDQLLVSLRASM